MMNSTLPQDITAKWIWNKTLPVDEDSYIFARKSFTLSQSGVDAHFWISASHSYQLFINGRFIGGGPSPAPHGICYADFYDLSYYMLTGINVIAIVAHHCKLPTYSHSGGIPGLWCQLNIDDKPTVASGSGWKVHPGDCYLQARPRKGQFLEFSEFCDLNKYPRGWRGESYYELGWEYPATVIPVEEFPDRLEAMPFDAPEFEELNHPWDLVSRGSIDPMAMIAQVHFSELVSGSGTYGARSFVFSESAGSRTVRLYSDSPCRVFVNDRLAATRITGEKLNYQEFQQELTAGWNEIFIIQQISPSSMGALLLFPGIRKGTVKFHVEPSKSAEDGWKIYGPFTKTFSEISPAIDTSLFLVGECRMEKLPVTDAQAYLDGCQIQSQKLTGQNDSPIVLERYQFVVLDLERLHFCFPGVSIDGKAGDIIDIRYGETLDQLDTPSRDERFRNTDTIRLRAGLNNWMKFEAVCFRYIMISTRRCASEIMLSNLFITHYAKDYRKNTLFSCADEEIGKIWDISRYLSLLSTRNRFIGIPFHRKTQNLGDSCILSRNSFYLSSDYELTRKALAEYAAAQYEDGSIPVRVNGVPDQNHIDQMMLFPLWVQEYFRFSGDADFMSRMLPHIERLLLYIAKSANPESGLLEDFQQWQNVSFFNEEGLNSCQGMVTGLNALYCRSLFSAAQLYEHAANPQRAEELRYLAAKIAGKVRKLTYIPKLECFADSFHDGAPSNSASIHTNILALYSGIALPEHAETIFARFFKAKNPFAALQQLPGMTFRTILLDTLYAYGKSTLALEYLRFCHNLIAKDKNPTPGLALDKTLPSNSYIIQEIAGIRLATPGFSTIYFSPDVSATNRLKVVLPTAYGKIKLEWKFDQDGNFIVKIDSNYPLEVVPQLPQELEEKTTLMLGKSVVVLDPDSAR